MTVQPNPPDAIADLLMEEAVSGVITGQGTLANTTLAVIKAVIDEGETLSLRTTFAPITEPERQRLRPLARRASLAINEEYQGFLRDFPKVAAASLPSEVFLFLGQASTSLASFGVAAGQVANTMGQGLSETGQQILKLNQDVAGLLSNPNPSALLSGMETAAFKTLMAKPSELLNEQIIKVANKGKNAKTKTKKAATAVAGATGQFAQAQAVDQLRRAALAGGPVPPLPAGKHGKKG